MKRIMLLFVMLISVGIIFPIDEIQSFKNGDLTYQFAEGKSGGYSGGSRSSFSSRSSSSYSGGSRSSSSYSGGSRSYSGSSSYSGGSRSSGGSSSYSGGGRSSSSYSGGSKSSSGSSKYSSGSGSSNKNSSYSSGSGSSYNNVKTTKFAEMKGKQVDGATGKKALDSYNARQSKFKQGAPVARVDSSRKQRYSDNVSRRVNSGNYSSSTGYRYGSDSYITRRETVFVNTPVYYGGYANYGIWDALALSYVINSLSYHNSAAFFYHNNNAETQMYLQQMREEAKNNAEMKVKLEQMEREMAAMKAKGVVPQEGYTPEGVDPDLMYSKEFVDQNPDVFYGQQNTQTEIQPQVQSRPVVSIIAQEDDGGSGWVWVVGFIVIIGVGYFVFVRRS